MPAPFSPQANEIAGRHVDPIVVVDIIADGEHCIGGSVGSGRLNQLHISVSTGEIIGIDRANTAITGAGDILQQWANLETLRGFSYRHIRVGEATKQVRGSHLAVSSELSLKSSLTIGAARAGGNVSRVQIDPTTIREKIIPMRVLVVIVCERIRRRGPDIATSCWEIGC